MSIAFDARRADLKPAAPSSGPTLPPTHNNPCAPPGMLPSSPSPRTPYGCTCRPY
ncbi:hypothetical protein K523DRAFT_323219 [Schizophyllum commune Tattone D]|nr:hypothetical protein K523DRAFT_323219 [Schizophyllum commune Tattone D]